MGPHDEDGCTVAPFHSSVDGGCHTRTELPLCCTCVTLKASPMVRSAHCRQRASLANVPALEPKGLGRGEEHPSPDSHIGFV